jgi:hypothetical protein
MAAQQTRLCFSFFFAAACLLASVGGWAQTGAEPAYLRGITALHQFEYEDANEAFLQARRINPSFVMAYWGEAMTYNQTLWRNEDVQAGRQALARLGITPAARRAKSTNPREQGFLGAVDVLFADGDTETRHRRYADEMARLYERFPDDADVASFYALALLGTMSRGLIGHLDAHEGHSQALAGSDTQSRVSEILGRVLLAHPDHMGALHYLLHNDDDPGHAHLALAAARTLAQLAPDSSHARHMPSHVFLQLGLWHDAADSDRAAFAASEAWVIAWYLAAITGLNRSIGHTARQIEHPDPVPGGSRHGHRPRWHRRPHGEGRPGQVPQVTENKSMPAIKVRKPAIRAIVQLISQNDGRVADRIGRATVRAR